MLEPHLASSPGWLVLVPSNGLQSYFELTGGIKLKENPRNVLCSRVSLIIVGPISGFGVLS